MITTAILAGLLTALGFILLAMKFGRPTILTLLGYAWGTDIVITLGCIALFGASGTAIGMLTGMVTGLFASLILSIVRQLIGYRKFTITRVKWYKVKFDHKDYEGAWVVRAKRYMTMLLTPRYKEPRTL